MEEAELQICRAVEQVQNDSNIEERVRELRIQALLRAQQIVGAYYQEFRNKILAMAICNKKIAYILEATSKNEMELILSSPKVHYNYQKIVPSNKYVIPEEELLAWSMASALGPLNDVGFNRFKEVFVEVFPDQEYIFDIIGDQGISEARGVYS